MGAERRDAGFRPRGWFLWLATLLTLLPLLLPARNALCAASPSGVMPHVSTVRVGYDRHFPPYEYMDEYGEPTGYNVEVLRAIGQYMGFRVQFIPGAWSEIRSRLDTGELDALSGMYYSEQRASNVEFSAPHSIVSNAIFVRKGSSISSYGDLKGKEVIVQEDDMMHDTLRADGIASRIITVTDQSDALTLLGAGRGEAALVGRSLGLLTIERFGLDNVTALESSIFPMEYCFAVAKGKAVLVSQLNEGLSTLKSTGKLKEIRNRWFSENEVASGSFYFRIIGWVFIPVMLLLVGMWLWSWSLRRQVNQKVVEIRRELSLRSRVEDALRESEDKYRILLENIQDGVFIREGGIIRFANAAFARMLGYASERELMPRNFVDLLVAGTEMPREPVGLTVGSCQYECGMLHQDGKTRVEVFIHEGPVHYEGRLSVVGTVKDMTARKAAEEALRESEQRYRELIDLLPQCVFEMDHEGNLLLVNRAGMRLLGYGREDFEHGMNLFDMLAPEDARRGVESIGMSREDELVSSREYTVLRKDGSRLPCLIYASPVVRGGATVGRRGIVIDMTDQRRLEEEIVKAQKLESLGILAGGIAHDFNNILTSILGNLSLARLYLGGAPVDVEKALGRVGDAETASHRARELTQQLLTFSRGGKPVKQLIPSAEIIRESVGFAARGSGVRCEFEVPDHLWSVEADGGQLTQVLNNLVINAAQAMGPGGRILVRAENVSAESAASYSLPRENHIRVCVRDHGTGIAREHLSRVFDPYFTTKQGGSGLGLATAYSIIRNHGGVISVDSTPGEGTEVCFFLPAVGKRAEPVMGRAEEPARGRGRILVMDDEEGVRDVVSEMLQLLGYRCVTVQDGREAVGVYGEAMTSRKPFAAVLMDLTIPGGMGGKDAVKAILELDPDARVIASSGYSNDPVMANHAEYGFRGVIAKPYRVKDLADTIGRILKSSERARH